MNQYFTDNLRKEDLIFGITVEDVQIIAEEMLRRKLKHNEMRLVQKGIESGLFDWAEVVRVAVSEADYQSKCFRR